MNTAHSRLSCLLFALFCFAGVMPSSVRAEERLYNGIVLPDEWPPRNETLSREPMRIPYLVSPPDCIPIDVGRQLFVDDFLIDRTTLERTCHTARFIPKNPVLTFDRRWELEGRVPFAAVFSDGVWFDPRDALFKMWYCGGYLQSTCYATSRDGIRWEKPALDVENGTNVVMRHVRDSNTVWLDHSDSDPRRRFKMFTATKTDDGWRLFLSCSPDGIHWSGRIAQSLPLGDRSTVFYNPFRRVWVYSIRINDRVIGRSRAYREHADPVKGIQWEKEDPVPWIGADRLDPHHPKFPDVEPQLYNLDAVAYESLMLGLFSVHQGPPNADCSRLHIQKRNEVLLGFSRDGFHWFRPDRRPFLGVTEKDGDWNWGNMQSAGGGCLIVGDQLYFYVSGRSRTDEFWDGRGSTGLGVIRRDGFVSMDAGSEGGVLTTRPVTFSGTHFFVNADADKGELRVEILDRDGGPIAPFTRGRSRPVTVDKTLTEVTWKGSKDLSAVAGKTVRIRFHLKNGSLYSFWVSPDQSGASNGYTAAGGPGFTGPVDTVGKKSY